MKPIRASVLTISDRVSRGAAEDRGGPRVESLLNEANGFEVVERAVVSDDPAAITGELRRLSRAHELVITTGGTGIGPRDHTPEATVEVISRRLPGFEEGMRAAGRANTPLADLSRAVVGIASRCLIINLPGSPKGISDGLGAIMRIIPHAVELLRKNVDDCAPTRSEFEE